MVINLRDHTKDIWDIVNDGLKRQVIKIGPFNEFTGLTDTPDSYSGEAGSGVRVNATEDALEFYTISGGTDELVGVDAAATPGYLGAAAGDGVLRTAAPLTYADGGDYITLGLDQTAISITESQISDLGAYLTEETDPIFVAHPAYAIDADDMTDINNLSGTNTGDQESSDFDHGGLGGLADNDHPQYPNAATAPIRIASQTIVLDKNDSDFKTDSSGSPATTKLGIYRTWDFDIINPNQVYSKDTQVFVAVAKADMTITRIRVELNATTNQVAGDLKYADSFISLASATVINDFDTTSGVRDDSTITSASVAAGKCIYIQFDSQPHADITQMHVHIEWDYD